MVIKPNLIPTRCWVGDRYSPTPLYQQFLIKFCQFDYFVYFCTCFRERKIYVRKAFAYSKNVLEVWPQIDVFHGIKQMSTYVDI